MSVSRGGHRAQDGQRNFERHNRISTCDHRISFICSHHPGSIWFAGCINKRARMDNFASRFQTSRLEIQRLQYRAWTAADHTHVIQDFRDSIDFSPSPDDWKKGYRSCLCQELMKFKSQKYLVKCSRRGFVLLCPAG
jgi:hypothetical protein